MKLSPRQEQVAELIAQGYTNKRISAELKLKLNTVEDYVTRLHKRLGGQGKPRHRIYVWWYNERPR